MLFVLYRDYLTGFHKRKVERQTKAKEEMKTMKREAKKMAKESVSSPFTLDVPEDVLEEEVGSVDGGEWRVWRC